MGPAAESPGAGRRRRGSSRPIRGTDRPPSGLRARVCGLARRAMRGGDRTATPRGVFADTTPGRRRGRSPVMGSGVHPWNVPSVGIRVPGSAHRPRLAFQPAPTGGATGRCRGRAVYHCRCRGALQLQVHAQCVVEVVHNVGRGSSEDRAEPLNCDRMDLLGLGFGVHLQAGRGCW